MKKTLLLFLVAFGLGSALAQEQTIFTLKENGSPTIHAQEVENGIVFQEFKGKVVLLSFFGKHCKWCMKEIPVLVDLQKRYKNSFQIVAIHAQEPLTPTEKIELYKKFNFNYPIYESDNNYNFTNYIAQRAGWTGSLPFTIVFDKDGDTVKIISGYAKKEILEHLIKVLTYNR